MFTSAGSNGFFRSTCNDLKRFLCCQSTMATAVVSDKLLHAHKGASEHAPAARCAQGPNKPSARPMPHPGARTYPEPPASPSPQRPRLLNSLTRHSRARQRAQCPLAGCLTMYACMRRCRCRAALRHHPLQLKRVATPSLATSLALEEHRHLLRQTKGRPVALPAVREQPARARQWPPHAKLNWVTMPCLSRGA
jgi:hypothetical protein